MKDYKRLKRKTEMNYTAKDIERAKELKSMGYNWIATNKDGIPYAYGRLPYRCADDDSNEYNIWDDQPGTPWLILSKKYFKSITWENEPVYIDEIITGGKVQVNGDTVIDRLTAENQRLKEEVTEQESIAAYEHATQMEWFSIAGDYKAENAGLKKRLDNAIELPCMQCVITLEWIDVEKRAWHCFKQWVVLYKDSCDQIVVEHCTSKDAAEVRLAELKGEQK